MPQKFFDLVKSSNFCAPLKLSFVWFTTEHGESGESKAVTSLRERKRRLPQSGLLLCVSVEAFLPHKFFAGAPQSTDFCFYQQYLLLRRVRKWALTPGLWLRRLRNLLSRWREWRLALINNAKWIVKRWRPSWFICWQLSGQRRMDSQMRWMLTKNSNELWWTDPKAMICRSQRVILERL